MRNKGWKIFGIIMLFILAALAVFLSIVAIVGVSNGLGFVGELERLGILKKAADAGGENAAALLTFRLR